jgi:aspartyl-tRNA synthetase
VTGLAVHDKDTVPTANLSTLLDNPVIRKRAPVDRAIQDVRNEVQYLFMEYLRARGFKKFEAPGLIATASEGGANVFELPYFGKSAYLARKLTSFLVSFQEDHLFVRLPPHFQPSRYYDQHTVKKLQN